MLWVALTIAEYVPGAHTVQWRAPVIRLGRRVGTLRQQQLFGCSY